MAANANDPSNIYLGAPDQDTTGSIAYAPEGTTLPTKPSDTLNNAFTTVGFINEDGVTISGLKAAGDALRDWGGIKVRQLAGDADPSVEFAMMETSKAALALVVGEDKVDEITATAQHGKITHIKFDNEMPEIHAMVIRIKDGKRRGILTFERVQVTELSDIELKRDGAISWKPKFSVMGGENGYVNWYIDDGNTTSGASS